MKTRVSDVFSATLLKASEVSVPWSPPCTLAQLQRPTARPATTLPLLSAPAHQDTQEAQSVAGSGCSTSCQSSSTRGGHRTERLPVKQPKSEAALLRPLSREASWDPSQQSLQLEGCDHFHPHCFCSTFQEVQGRIKWWMWGHRLPERTSLGAAVPHTQLQAHKVYKELDVDH